jgi:hypothetical protein
MSRLNLDLFSEPPGATEKKRIETAYTPSVDISYPETSALAIGPKENEQENESAASPKFVPVGFHEKHLALLDDAVLKLRRQGHWKASKSGIIRRLIELHADNLQSIWLEGAGHKERVESHVDPDPEPRGD